jgi:putative FmdB family regulatory protein
MLAPDPIAKDPLMPIYEYACGACGHRFEEWQKMSDPPVRTCPKCKAKKVEKLISQTSFTLKGGGWYSDLYAGPKPGASSKGDSSKSDSDGSSSESSGAKEPSSSSETKSDKSDKSGTKAASPAKKSKKTGAA